MKRLQMCHKINRNNTEFLNDVYTNPLSVNMIDPVFASNENWQHHDVTGVDIIELNDSDVSETSDETLKLNLNHAWSYTSNTIKSPKQSQHNNYRVNRKAREKRRLKNEQSFTSSPSVYTPNNFSDNIDVTTSDYKNNIRFKRQINCFTIINQKFINSDTSSENTECENIEQSRPIGDGLKENQDYNKTVGEETLTYSSDCDAEKKTIWIYSFKNKRLLPTEYIEMVNIPSNETDSSTSFSFEKFEEDTDSISRVASPIPPPYIPRLNLSLGQTLSTVTEVTEPNKPLSSVETERLTKVPVKKRSKNTWLLNNSKNNGDCINSQEKTTNVINWMGLSPRERRRIFRENNSVSDVVFEDKVAKLQEVIRNTKTKILIGQASDNKMFSNIHSRTVDVDIHGTIPNSSNVFVKEPEKDPIVNQFDSLQIEVARDVEVLPDDENVQEVYKCLRKPQINISRKCLRNSRNITDPLEKLNTDNWIVEETDDQPAAYSYDLERHIDSSNDDYKLTANDRLWSKNALALMKPAQWNEYAPIAESHLSLHLSLDANVGKQKWVSRFINLFKCCNYSCYQ